MSEWQDISTAPTSRPVYYAGWRQSLIMGTDGEIQLEWVKGFGIVKKKNQRGFPAPCHPGWVTHWKPAPPPPAEQ